jgi:uncharacterized protein
MRKDVEINAEGTILRGWFYTPDRASGKAPAIVMAHGFSAVKEMYLERFAEHFCEAGLAAVVFDNRNFGASDGQPRQEIDPWVQVRDYRHAITWARTQEEVDPERIGVWGSSYSGGHALVVGAIDRRVKCVVSQVPLISGYRNIQRLVRPDFIGPLRAQLDADRDARFRGEAPAMIPVVAADPLAPSALPTHDSYQWFIETGRERAKAWRNEVTLQHARDADGVRAQQLHRPDKSDPADAGVVAVNDTLTVAELATTAFNDALEPKRLVLLGGGHFDAYVSDFENAANPERDWFVTHLAP